MADAESLAVAAALEAERQFVLTLGGFALEIPGANLVTHERLPVPRFNFVQEMGVGPERQSAFFERALDHYFQRALRPTFRVPEPVGDHVDAGLRRFGFRPRATPLVLLLEGTDRGPTTAPPTGVRPARRSEIDLVASFWTSERERPEFRAALDVAWSHPNPHERLQPLLAFRGPEAVSVALVYRYRSAAGIHAVATRPAARGQGGASDLVRFVLATDAVGPGVRYSMFADSERLARRLEQLGFRPARSFREYELPAGADLDLPAPGPVGPPRWRPPRDRGPVAE
ncbi:MAG: GNAT family N-acetyltransferase [Thermoplasmata archaeon]